MTKSQDERKVLVAKRSRRTVVALYVLFRRLYISFSAPRMTGGVRGRKKDLHYKIIGFGGKGPLDEYCILFPVDLKGFESYKRMCGVMEWDS